MANGEWKEMEKLVLSKMTEHGKKLDRVHTDISTLKTQMAIINDRGDRETQMAKTASIKWSTAVSVLVSGMVNAFLGWGRGSWD